MLDPENENLRAQVKAMQYEVNSLKSEREFERLRHEQALRDVQERADADFKKAQVGEAPLESFQARDSWADLAGAGLR
ncbi:MAG: hypothetical protein Q9196_004106, partial [Gyalolechia fulgens]